MSGTGPTDSRFERKVIPGRRARLATAITRTCADPPASGGIRRIMSAKSSVLPFRRTTPRQLVGSEDDTRRPTEAEREYVRARARDAARAIFEAEQRNTPPAGDEVDVCE